MTDRNARFRKAFKYKTDDYDDDDSTAEMDEQEQETFLQTIREQEQNTNELYTKIFTALPLILTLPFFFSILTHPRSTALLSLLSITSLLATAYTMYLIPIHTPPGSPATSRTGLKPSSAFASHVKIPPTSTLRSWLGLSEIDNDDGPINVYMPYLNVGICAVLTLASFAVKNSKRHTGEGFWFLLLMPTVILVVVSVVRKSMSEVQGGLKELDGMKYDYKGA